MIYGSLLAIDGFFGSFVGSLPGILAIFIGNFIRYTGMHAKELIHAKHRQHLIGDHLLKYMGQSFLLFGITMITFIVFYGLNIAVLWLYS